MTKTRTYSWQDPLAIAQKAKERSGYNFLKEVLAQGFQSPIESTIDFKICHIEKGAVSFELTPQEYHYNPIGTVHGGVISILLDSAMACSVHSKLAQGEGYTTLELKVNMIKPITVNTGKLIATGKLIHLGKSTALVEASLLDQEGVTYAHGLSTCMIFRQKQNTNK